MSKSKLDEYSVYGVLALFLSVYGISIGLYDLPYIVWINYCCNLLLRKDQSNPILICNS